MPVRNHSSPVSSRELSGIAPTPKGPVKVTFGRQIQRVERSETAPAEYLLPGFVDLQINGAYGIDVMSASASELLKLSAKLAREGTTAWLPTVITSPLETIERCDRVIADATIAQTEAVDHADATILGMHLEGPFISPERLGAHPALDLLPTGEALERVLALKTLKLITIAPELDGAIDAIARLVARGIAVSLGHSDATYAEAIAGVNVGARMFTHVFNAMRPLHHREPGIVGAALCEPRAYPAFIGDGVHVHPDLIRAQLRSYRSILVSDRVSPAGAAPCEYSIFGGLVEGVRISDGAARLADGTLAGSATAMLDALRNLLHPQVVKSRSGHEGMKYISMVIANATAEGPATVLGRADRGRIAAHAPADLLLLDSTLNLKAVFIGGREID